jgi:hypothetical protein
MRAVMPHYEVFRVKSGGFCYGSKNARHPPPFCRARSWLISLSDQAREGPRLQTERDGWALQRMAYSR